MREKEELALPRYVQQATPGDRDSMALPTHRKHTISFVSVVVYGVNGMVPDSISHP